MTTVTMYVSQNTEVVVLVGNTSYADASVDDIMRNSEQQLCGTSASFDTWVVDQVFNTTNVSIKSEFAHLHTLKRMCTCYIRSYALSSYRSQTWNIY